MTIFSGNSAAGRGVQAVRRGALLAVVVLVATGCRTVARRPPAELSLLVANVSHQRAGVPMQELLVYDPSQADRPPTRVLSLLGQEWPLQLIAPLGPARYLAGRRLRDTVDQTHQELVSVDLKRRTLETLVDRFDHFLWTSHHHVVYTVAPAGEVGTASVGSGTRVPDVKPTGLRLMRYWITGDSVEPIIDRPVRVLHRLAGTECVVLITRPQPVIAMLDWFTGQYADVFRLPPGGAVSASILGKDGRNLLLVLQFVGRSWDLFDLYLLNVPNRSARLLRTNISCPLDPHSLFAPRLPVVFLDEQTIAFVEAGTTRRGDGSVADVRYNTVIVKLATNRVLQRQEHPAAGLAKAPPAPYLPSETLARLGLGEPPPAPIWPSSPGDHSSADGSASMSWQQFLSYKDGRLRAGDDTSFAPEQVDMFRVSPTGTVLAARLKRDTDQQPNELLVISAHPGRIYSFPVKLISRLYWLDADAKR